MDDELVLLTSYFNLAGGRRQDTADTFRVEASVSSATSPDGTAALYVVTEASTFGHMGPRARRRAADVVAWEYSTHSDDPPAPRLKAALRAAHEAVLNEFDGHVAVGLSVMAVEKDTVYLGQVAPAQVYVLHDGNLHSISATASGSADFARSIGSTAGAEISVFKDQIGPEDVIALCSSWFHRSLEPEELRESFGGETADDIAETLLELAKQQDVREATGIIVEAVPASSLDAMTEDQPPTFMEQVDEAVQALANVGRMLWSEFRAQPSTQHANGSRSAPIEEGVPAARTDLETGSSVDTSVWPAPQPDRTREQPATGTTIYDPEIGGGWDVEDLPPASGGRSREQLTEEVPIVPAESSPEPPRRRRFARDEPLSELDQVNSRIQNAPELGDVIPPVQTFPDTSTEPERIYATSKSIQAVNKRPRRFGGARGEGESGPAVIRPGLGDIDLSRPASRPAPPGVIWFGVVVVFFLVAGSIWLFLRHHSPTPVHANPYPAQVKKDLRLAQQQTSPSQQDFYIQKARSDVALARVNGSLAPQIKSLKAQIQSVSDTLRHVSRENAPLLLSDFGRYPGAKPAEIAPSGSALFVLDSGRNGVYSISPNASSNPASVVQHGDVISGFTIGSLMHITTDGSTVLVLDDHNVLVRDSGTAPKSATSLPQTTPQPGRMVAVSTADPDVYLLDTLNNQVWRYPQAVISINPPQDAFFTPTPTSLKTAIAFDFDHTNLYILRADGTILKFDIIQANPQKWTTNAAVMRKPLQNPVALYAAPGLNYVWVADPANTRIVQFNLSGGFVRSYKSGSNAMDFSQIKSIAVAPSGNTLYVLCGSKVFDFPVQH